jgi:hypothetical protein
MHTSEVKNVNPAVSYRVGADLMFKDEVLTKLNAVANIAQFVSFGPDLNQRFSSIRGYKSNHLFPSVDTAAVALLEASPESSVNVRSFTPTDPKSREFIYGLKTSHEVATAVARLASAGLYTIINETIDVNDGGVSGVLIGDVLEFAPGDTPRCVEKPGTASLSREVGLRLLELVYNFKPNLNFDQNLRVEFSIHPLRRGVRHDHTIIWELEDVGTAELKADTRWPNRFSRFIGDKAFGLLVAHMVGLPVPLTTVISRALPPFTFGETTGTAEKWIRTCPVEQVPGKFTTQRGWRDPYKLMSNEDPEGNVLASILSQEGVETIYAGALVTTPEGTQIIEGVKGSGDDFMLGRMAPQSLPDEVIQSVRRLYGKAVSILGPVRFEWVYDGNQAWAVQLHKGATVTTGRIVYPGKADQYHEFNLAEGIDALRSLISKVEGTGNGIVVLGDVGVTSHIGDLLRRAKIPSHIESK